MYPRVLNLRDCCDLKITNDGKQFCDAITKENPLIHDASKIKAVHAEIEYYDPYLPPIGEGFAPGGIRHSDICPPGHLEKNMHDPEYQKFLHDCLQEWLDKSHGTGQFYIRGFSS